MLNKMYQFSGWVLADPARIRLALMGVAVALMVVSALAPGIVIRADEAIGGGH